MQRVKAQRHHLMDAQWHTALQLWWPGLYSQNPFTQAQVHTRHAQDEAPHAKRNAGLKRAPRQLADHGAPPPLRPPNTTSLYSSAACPLLPRCAALHAALCASQCFFWHSRLQGEVGGQE